MAFQAREVNGASRESTYSEPIFGADPDRRRKRPRQTSENPPKLAPKCEAVVVCQEAAGSSDLVVLEPDTGFVIIKGFVTPGVGVSRPRKL